MPQGIGGGIILAVVNFLMVFLVLGGLAGVLVGLKWLILSLEKPQNQKAASSERITEAESKAPETLHDQGQKKHLAAITAALQEFTSQSAGALRIDSVEPLDVPPVPTNQHLAVITAALHHYLETPKGSLGIDYIRPITVDPIFVAISAALHEYLATPEGSFRIVRIQPVGTVNTWKMAGRLDLMGFDNN